MSDSDSQAAAKAPLSSEHLKVLVDLRVAQLRVLAAQTALDCALARVRLGTLSRRPEQVGEDQDESAEELLQEGRLQEDQRDQQKAENRRGDVGFSLSSSQGNFLTYLLRTHPWTIL
jgi:hypothetical protein